MLASNKKKLPSKLDTLNNSIIFLLYRRQARLELDVPSAANNPTSVGGAPCNGGSIADSISPSSGSRDHGMRTPPGPPSMPPGPPGGSLPGSTATLSSSSSSLSHARQSFGVRRPTTLHQDDSIGVQNR